MPLSPRETRWYFGYGTITRTPDLPRGGMRGTGIKPHVTIDLQTERDPIGVVDKALAAKRP